MKDWSDCKGQWAAMSSKARASPIPPTLGRSLTWDGIRHLQRSYHTAIIGDRRSPGRDWSEGQELSEEGWENFISWVQPPGSAGGSPAQQPCEVGEPFTQVTSEMGKWAALLHAVGCVRWREKATVRSEHGCKSASEDSGDHSCYYYGCYYYYYCCTDGVNGWGRGV